MRISDWSSDVCSSDLLELTTYLFAWLVLIGASYGVKISAHLGVDAFVKLFPARHQRYLILLAALLCCVYAAIMLYGAWAYWSKCLRFGIDTEDLYVPRFILEALGGPAYVHEPDIGRASCRERVCQYV